MHGGMVYGFLPQGDDVRLADFATYMTGEVYGAQAVPFLEDAPLLGTTTYARAKIAGEAAVREAVPEAFVLRPAIVVGPTQTGAMFVPAAVTALRARTPLRMTPGEQTRDHVLVDDVADAIARCLAPAAPPGNGTSGSAIPTPSTPC